MAVKETLNCMKSKTGQMLRLFEWCRIKQYKGEERAQRAALLAKTSSKFRRTRSEKIEPVIHGRVRCHGKLHRYTSVMGGKFTIHDHTEEEQKAFVTLQKLGAELPRCMVLQNSLRLKSLATEERKGVPQELNPHWLLRSVVRGRRFHAYPEVEEPDLKQRLKNSQAASIAALREVDWPNQFGNAYPNVRKRVIGFASEGIPVGCDIRHIMQADVNMKLGMFGIELIAAVPREWPRWFKEGYGVLSNKLVLGVRRESPTIMTVDLAEYDPVIGGIVIRKRTARIAEDNNWRLV